VRELSGTKRVFISWSKPQSKRVALVLKGYLEELIDGVEVFVSDQDIGPGERSMKVVESQLDGTTFGIAIVTQQNQTEPWLNFEAGALSKSVGNDELGVPRVIPLLIDLESESQLTGPLSQFKAVKSDHDGISRIITSIADLVGTSRDHVARRFERAWPELQAKLSDAGERGTGSVRPARSPDDKLDEILEILRSLQRSVPADVNGNIALKQTSGTFNRKSLRLLIQRLALQHDLVLRKIDTIVSGRPTSISVAPLSTRELAEDQLDSFSEKLHDLVGGDTRIELVE
jgi:hypothetical protein